VFERVVATCIAAGLVGGEAFSIDASLIRADVDQTRRMPGEEAVEWPKPEETSRAITEYLEALDEARATEDDGDGGSDRKPPKQISLTDPQAAWVARKKMSPFFAYDANYLIDNRLGIIVDAEGTRANRSAEIAVTETMIARVARRYALSPKRLAADTVYGTGHLLKWLTDRDIAPHIPVWDKSQQTNGRFTRDDFSYDRERDVYICPGGKLLTSTGNIDQGRILYYRALKSDCSACSLKPQCTTGPMRKVTRDIDEAVRDRVRALANTEAFRQSRRERKKVEMLFAHMKRILKLDRLRLRGLSGARDEVLLVATAQNLRKLAKYVERPLPGASNRLRCVSSRRLPPVSTETVAGASKALRSDTPKRANPRHMSFATQSSAEQTSRAECRTSESCHFRTFAGSHLKLAGAIQCGRMPP
jgi:hypothetical protein